MNRLEGKLAVLTGSTAGIGLATAERLGEEGAKVVISSRKKENVDKALEYLKSKSIKAKGVVCHVKDTDAIHNLMKEASQFSDSKIDIVFCNAAINPAATTLSKTSLSVIDAIMNINIKGTIVTVQAALPYMSKGGSIILNSSISAFHLPKHEIIGMYGVSKTALLGVTKTFARELGEKGIRVNCVAPGTVYTRFADMIIQTPEIHKLMIEQTAMKRIGHAKEIASIVAFLASDDSSFITGETIVASGGAPSRLVTILVLHTAMTTTYGDQLTVFNQFLAKSDGKDKLCATIQYACLFASAGSPGNIKKIQASIAGARKVFRILKPLETITPLILKPGFEENSSKLLQSLTKIKAVCMTIYMALDHVAWMGQAGLLSNKIILKHCQKISLSGWLGGSICTIIAQCHKIADLVIELRRSIDNAELPSQREAIARRIYSQVVTLIHAVLQATLAVGLLEIVPMKSRHVGLVGVLASALNCYMLYPTSTAIKEKSA